MISRLIAVPLVVLALSASAAHAQAPGQIPGTLPPAPPIITPPPPVAPAPVPSAVTPLPQPDFGVPRNINSGPIIGGGTSRYIYRGERPPKKRKFRRRHRHVSEIQLIQRV